MWSDTHLVYQLYNSTGVNASSSRSFSYYSLFIVPFYLIPLGILNFVVLVVIVRDRSIPGFIRLILANTLISSEIVIVGMIQIFLANVILPFVDDKSPDAQYACRLALVAISSGGAGRFLFMSAFAAAVYHLVRSGTAHIKMRPTIIASIILWICAILPNTAVFFPQIIKTVFIHDVVCAFYGVAPLIFIYSIGCIVIYGLCNILLGLIFPYLTTLYIKTHTVSGDMEAKRGMIKYTVFLCLGNMVSFLGLTIPLIVATAVREVPDDFTASATVATQGILVMLSLVPVPICMVIYFKNIRRKFTTCFCILYSYLNICKFKYNVV